MSDLLTHYQEWINGMMAGSSLNEKVFGLAEETGEVLGKMKRRERLDYESLDDEFERAIELELGDVLFYLTSIALHNGLTIERLIESNMEKINSRAVRGKIRGKGDSR